VDLMRGPNNRPAQFIWDAHRGKLQKPVGKVDDYKLQRRHVRDTGRARRAATAATSAPQCFAQQCSAASMANRHGVANRSALGLRAVRVPKSPHPIAFG
jgi:hypothetical protein